MDCITIKCTLIIQNGCEAKCTLPHLANNFSLGKHVGALPCANTVRAKRAHFPGGYETLQFKFEILIQRLWEPNIPPALKGPTFNKYKENFVRCYHYCQRLVADKSFALLFSLRHYSFEFQPLALTYHYQDIA